MSFLLAALSLGFLGSFHCIGMCGPIALALPLATQNRWKKIIGALVYNSGRMVTYGILGLVFGLLGKSFVIGGYQQVLSVTLGVIILLGLFFPAKLTSAIGLTKVIYPVVKEVKSLLHGLFRQKNSNGALFLIGLLNGLLPCGLVYVGVAGAIATGEAIEGSLFMMMFGAGTIPAMLLVGLAANIISLAWRNKIRKAVPVFVAVMAVALILRGMNLGIPYVSPELSKTDCIKNSCCHKK